MLLHGTNVSPPIWGLFGFTNFEDKGWIQEKSARATPQSKRYVSYLYCFEEFVNGGSQLTNMVYTIDSRRVALIEVSPLHFSPESNLYLQNVPIVNE